MWLRRSGTIRHHTFGRSVQLGRPVAELITPGYGSRVSRESVLRRCGPAESAPRPRGWRFELSCPIQRPTITRSFHAFFRTISRCHCSHTHTESMAHHCFSAIATARPCTVRRRRSGRPIYMRCMTIYRAATRNYSNIVANYLHTLPLYSLLLPPPKKLLVVSLCVEGKHALIITKQARAKKCLRAATRVRLLACTMLP